MFTIYTESKFLKEKEYVFHVIFREILGIDFSIRDSSVAKVYKIVLSNGKYLEFADDFFSLIPESIGYCQEKYLPTRVSIVRNIIDDEIPFIYGNNTYTEHENYTYCGGDFVASAFFMLSRWEEFICTSFDRYGRFPEDKSFAIQTGIIKKPIVHIYAELLRSLFLKNGYAIPQRHKFQKTLTHDIDFLYKWGKPSDFIKSCFGDIFRRFSFQTFRSSVSMWKFHKDPYDVYQNLMDLSKHVGLKSTFYFLFSKSNEWKLETEQGKRIIQLILKNKQTLGIHSNYYLEKDADKILSDKEFYENLFGQKLTLNRQHFLKLRMPQTLRVLEQCGIDQDSSLYYSHTPGFRTGMCIEHSMFDCERREMLKIKELPLTIMDGSLLDARKYDEAIQWVDELYTTVKKYKGNFVCLWHNSSFNAREWQFIKGVYEYIVKDLV